MSLPQLTWGNALVGFLLYKIGQAVWSIISGARAAKRINVQLATLFTYMSIKDPVFAMVLAKTKIDMIGKKE